MVKKILVVFVVALLSLALFAPKRELYYLLEDKLAKEGIIIHDEEIKDGLISLTLNHPKIYYKGLLVADITKIKLWTIFFYSRVAIGHIKVDSSFDKFVPSPITKVQISYSLSNPKNLSLLVIGNFENIIGELSLVTKKVHIDVTDKKLIAKFKSQLKKGEKGWHYETSL